MRTITVLLLLGSLLITPLPVADADDSVADEAGWEFDGRKSYLLAPDSASLSKITLDRALSLSAWVRVDAPQRGGIIAKRGSRESWTPHFLLEVNRHEAGEIRFSIDDGSERAEILHPATGGRWGEWQLITGVWDGDEVRLYVDGEPAASAAASAVQGWENAGSRLSLGAHHIEEGGQSSHFGGALREARVYDRALSDDEAARLYTMQEVREGLTGYWPLDRKVVDESGHANDATIFAPAAAPSRPAVAEGDDSPRVDFYRTLLSASATRGNDAQPIMTRQDFAGVGAAGREAGNLNGPSVIRVPDWIPRHERPAEDADYYMYFAHHGGRYIRMAYANDPEGPWQLFNIGDAVDTSLGDAGQNVPPRRTPGRGVVDLDLGNSDRIDTGRFEAHGHIASPDVVIDHANRRLAMYLHGPSSIGGQQTFITTSRYGLNFNQPADGGERFEGETHGFRDVIPGFFYFRTFEVAGRTFSYANLARLYRAPATTAAGEPATLANADEGGGLWQPGPDADRSGYWEQIADEHNPIRQVYTRIGREPTSQRHGGLWDPRHFAVLHDEAVDPDRIFVLYSASGDTPERILMTVIDLTGLDDRQRVDPANWSILDPPQQTVLEPATPWEGADLALAESSKGGATGVRELRDPFLFLDDDGSMYLYYSGRGEEAIGVARFEIVE